MLKTFNYKIQLNSQNDTAVVSLELKKKSVVNFTIRLLVGTVVFNYNRILDKGEHKIEVNNLILKKGTYLTFLQVNEELEMNKLIIQ